MKLCYECGEAPISCRYMCKRCYHRYYMRMTQSPETWEGWPHERVLVKNGKCEYCNRKATAKNLCGMHYRRMYVRGLLEVNLGTY